MMSANLDQYCTNSKPNYYYYYFLPFYFPQNLQSKTYFAFFLIFKKNKTLKYICDIENQIIGGNVNKCHAVFFFKSICWKQSR